jgi:hypothetical protein
MSNFDKVVANWKVVFAARELGGYLRTALAGPEPRREKGALFVSGVTPNRLMLEVSACEDRRRKNPLWVEVSYEKDYEGEYKEPERVPISTEKSVEKFLKNFNIPA